MAVVLMLAGMVGTSAVLAQGERAVTGLAAAVERAAETHTVRMVMKEGAYRFEPAEVKARGGDRIVFVLESGAPHNVAFDAEKVPASAKAALSRALPDRMSELAGPLLTGDGATYTLVLAGVPPGRYPFYCMPHMGVGMTGVLVVEP